MHRKETALAQNIFILSESKHYIMLHINITKIKHNARISVNATVLVGVKYRHPLRNTHEQKRQPDII